MLPGAVISKDWCANSITSKTWASGRRVPFALDPQGKGWLLRLPGAGAGMYVLRCGGQRVAPMNNAD
jgi:hypothetical protein